MFAVLTPARKAIGRLAVVFSVLWLAACGAPMPGGMTGGGGGAIDTSRPVPVALLVPRGSESSQERQLAGDLENAARLAISDLQGVEIDLRVYDDAGSAEQAREVAMEAVNDGAQIILGPLHGESANAAAVAVADRNVNVLAFTNNSTVAGGNLFILGQTFGNTANRLTAHAVREGKPRILAVHSENLSGRQGLQAIEGAITANGAQSAGAVSYQLSQDGIYDAVSRIKDAADESNADAIFLTSTTSGALPLLSQMLPESGLDPADTQYIGLARWDTPRQTLELPGVQGGWFAMPDPRRVAGFRTRFEDANGSTPHPLSALAYDGIAAIGALAQSGGRDALSRSSLMQSAGFEGVNGVFRFLSDGTNERGLAVATVRDNEVEILDPAPRSFGGAGF